MTLDLYFVLKAVLGEGDFDRLVCMCTEDPCPPVDCPLVVSQERVLLVRIPKAVRIEDPLLGTCPRQCEELLRREAVQGILYWRDFGPRELVDNDRCPCPVGFADGQCMPAVADVVVVVVVEPKIHFVPDQLPTGVASSTSLQFVVSTVVPDVAFVEAFVLAIAVGLPELVV